jgi:hypothetical protein
MKSFRAHRLIIVSLVESREGRNIVTKVMHSVAIAFFNYVSFAYTYAMQVVS